MVHLRLNSEERLTRRNTRPFTRQREICIFRVSRFSRSRRDGDDNKGGGKKKVRNIIREIQDDHLDVSNIANVRRAERVLFRCRNSARSNFIARTIL